MLSPTPSEPPLPAAATKRLPDLSMASLRARLKPPPPQELLEILMPIFLAYPMASMAPAVLLQPGPVPLPLRNLRAMILTFGATPTMPVLFTEAAMVPETWVPWASSPGSWTVLSLWQKSQPLTSST